MLSREDFVFTIGYDGPIAVVDKKARQRYKSLSSKELAEKGLFRPAYASAIWSKKPEEMDEVLAIYNKTIGTPLAPGVSLERLFGVFLMDVKRTMAL